ncbi:hypothetical protein EON65_42295 [archaeon]|nr:MAG: hypothetical protein EON65_42295 [archaeon]
MAYSVPNEYIEAFLEDGVVVIPNVLSEEEISAARAGFHATLLEHGVDVNDLLNTGHNLAKLSSTHGSGGVLDLYYYKWKLALNQHPKIVCALQSLWRASYGAYRGYGSTSSSSNDSSDLWKHPYCEFDSDKAYMFIDRVCFRLPTHLSDAIAEEKRGGGKCDATSTISKVHTSDGSKPSKGKKSKSLQRSLTPHLDCCPQDMYNNLNKWRPIQAFVSLTDTLMPNEGGLEAARGFHKGFQRWSEQRKGSQEGEGRKLCVGQYTAMRPREDADVIAKMEHIPCRLLVVCGYIGVL